MVKYITLLFVYLLPFQGNGQVAKAGDGQTIYLTSTSTATLDGSASHGIKYHWTDVSTDYGSGKITNQYSKKTTVTGLSQGVFYYQLTVTTGRESVYSITTVKVDYAPPLTTGILVKTLPIAGIKPLTNNRSDTLHYVGYTFPNLYVDPTWGEIWMERARLNQQFVDAQSGKYYTTIEDGYDWQGKGYDRSELYFGDYSLKIGEIYMFEWKGYFPQPIIGNIPDVQDGQFARATAIMQIHGSDGYPPPFGFGIRQDSIVFNEWGHNGNGATSSTKVMPTDNSYIEKAHTIRFYLKEGPAGSGAFIKVLVDGVLKYERTSGQVGQTLGTDWVKFASLYDWGNFIVDPNNHTRQKKFSLVTEAFNIYTVTDTSTLAQTRNSIFSDNKLKSSLDTAVDYAARIYLQDSNTNGVSIGIYYKAKNYTYNYGKSKLATANNYYNIGSVAKTFVTTILAQAVIGKKVSLNDDIRKFLPGTYPNLQYNGQPIHFVNLANHTSGLPTTFRKFSSEIQDSLRKLNIAQQVHFLSLYTEDSLLSDLHFVKPGSLPGTKFQYNSTAMELLEVLLERIYKKPYEEIVTEFLRTHLKMFDTKLFLTEAEIKRAVQGYNAIGNPQEFLNLKGNYFGPTMNSTVNDMLKYIKANITNNDKAIKLTHQLTFGKGNGFGIGLGWMMDNDNTGERYIYHDGNTKIGYNTLCLFYPGKGLGFIIIANDTTSQENVGQIENNIKTRLDKQ